MNGNVATIKRPAKKLGRARIRKYTSSANPNRKKMTVSDDLVEQIHDMNKKALKVLAKRA